MARPRSIDAAELADRFRARFGTQPRVFRAPGRINIIGEHTDYSEGFAMPAAIDRDCLVAIAANGSDRLRVASCDLPDTLDGDLATLVPQGGWTDYVAGVAKVLQDDGIVLAGADLLVASAVPIGAGVSSSAALEVAATLALLALAGRKADSLQIARWAQAAENGFVGMPCGIMDQFASAGGVAQAALLLDCRSLHARTLPLPETAAFLLVDSTIRHALAEGEYARRRADTEAAAKCLGVAALRDVTAADLPVALARLSGDVLRRCRHVVSENARVGMAARAMVDGDLAALGALMNQSHCSLRDDMQVSVPEVDTLVEIAQNASGTYGARMMGGGFGGSVLVLVDRDGAARIAEDIAGRYGARIGRPPQTLLCRAVSGASEVLP